MMDNNHALRTIEAHRRQLTRQQFRTLMGQAKAGNPDAALRGLDKIIKRGAEKNG